MDLLDLIIVAIALIAIASGWRRGVVWVALSLAGLLGGLVIGAAIAPPLAKHLASHQPNAQALIGTAIFLISIAIFQGVGTTLGFRLRAYTARSRFAALDSSFGSLLAVVGVLAGAWYLGRAFAGSPYSNLDQQINGSAILQRLDTIAPKPPSFLASIEELLRGKSFPNPFASLGPTVLPPVAIPSNVDTPGVRAVQQVTSKVLSRGCGIEAGSSWPLGNDYMVTNAHVVAGGQRGGITVETPDGRSLDATVVLFDPEVDVAVLYVPGIHFAALPMAPGDPARATQGAVVGYPGGGAEEVSAAAVRGTESAEGRDIYGDRLVTRDIEVLAAHVIPGNSGGPAVDLSGRVIGLVFAASTVDPNEGYALTTTQVAGDLQSAMGRTAAVDTQDCTS